MTFVELPPRAANKTGQRFTRLLVLGPVERPAGMSITSKFAWLCRCDCGQEKVISGSKLTEGSAKSCGCLRREASWVHDGNKSHGLCYSTEYGIWKGIRRRCENKEYPKYPWYGGRGITVCPRWKTFENFYVDMGPRSSPKHTIDRRDNDGNYERGNCRWATRRQQSANMRGNLVVTAFGRTAALAEFFNSSICADYNRAHYRITIGGWNAERAITAPPYAGR